MISLVLLLIVGINGASTLSCNHFPVMQDITHVESAAFNASGIDKSNDEFSSNVVGSEFRIKMEYQSAFSSHPEFANMKSNLEAAINRIKESVRVRKPIVNKLLFQRQCKTSTSYYVKQGDIRTQYCSDGCESVTKCMHWAIPDKYLKKCYYMNGNTPSTSGTDGEGLQNVDLVLFVDRFDSNCADTTVAWASSCQLDDDINRPVLGGINICKGYFNIKSDNVRQQTLLHEILHVLAFSPNLYAFFHDEFGNPRTPRNSITNIPSAGLTAKPYNHYTATGTIKDIYMPFKSVYGSHSTKINVMNTPSVLREVRNYFGCQSMEGLYLEDYLDSYAHVESLFYQTNVMRATINAIMHYTRIELAVLQDSGWYIVDYSKADKSVYGKNLGCTFAQKGCLNYIDQQLQIGKPVYPYCTRNNLSGQYFRCNADYTSQIGCTSYTLSQDLPLNNQYFKSQPKVGGKDIRNMYCPTIDLLETSNCKDENINKLITNNVYYESFGKTSFCFPVNEKPTVTTSNVPKTVTNWGSMCYKIECSTAGRFYEVIVDSKRYKCQSTGQIIRVDGTYNLITDFTVSLACPDYEVLCLLDKTTKATTTTTHDPALKTATSNEYCLFYVNFAAMIYKIINYY